MPVSMTDIMEACELIANQRHLNVCIAESMKGGAIAGLSALSLGIIFGPVGIAVGGAMGGLLGAKMAKRYVPLTEILRNMTAEDKAKLTNHMLAIVQSLDITDALLLISIASNPQAQAYGTIVRGMGTYFGQQWD